MLNFNEKAERVYKINVGMPPLIQSSEDVFFRMFYDLEVLVCIGALEISDLLLNGKYAFPIYYEMVCAIISFEENDRSSCIKHLDNVSQRLRHALLIFFEGLTDS